MMRQVKIISVEGSYLITSDGSMVFPCGNKVFNPGDYAWVNGNIAFGNTPAGGNSIVYSDDDVIPYAAYGEGKFSFGKINLKGIQAAFSLEKELPLNCIFVNDKTTAFFLKTNKNYDIDIYNLISGKIFLQKNGLPMNANLDDDGNLFFGVWNCDLATAPTLQYTSHNPTIITESDIVIYKNDAVFFDFKNPIHDVLQLVGNEINAAYGEIENLWRWDTVIRSVSLSIDKDGSAKYICLASTDVHINNKDALPTIYNLYKYFQISIDKNASYTVQKIPLELQIPVNDSFYYISGIGKDMFPNTNGTQLCQNGTGVILPVQPLAYINGWVGGCSLGIRCVLPYKNGFLVNLQTQFGESSETANNALVFIAKDQQNTLFKPDVCFNTRFESISKSRYNLLSMNLQKIWKGQDADE